MMTRMTARKAFKVLMSYGIQRNLARKCAAAMAAMNPQIQKWEDDRRKKEKEERERMAHDR